MTKDPAQEENKESPNRVYRGSSWNSHADDLVVSYRIYFPPSNRRCILGFRPVRNAKEKTC